MHYMMQITETVLFPVIVVFGNNCIFNLLSEWVLQRPPLVARKGKLQD